MRFQFDWYVSALCLGAHGLLLSMLGIEIYTHKASIFVHLLLAAIFLLQVRDEAGDPAILPSAIVGTIAFIFLANL